MLLVCVCIQHATAQLPDHAFCTPHLCQKQLHCQSTLQLECVAYMAYFAQLRDLRSQLYREVSDCGQLLPVSVVWPVMLGWTAGGQRGAGGRCSVAVGLG